MFKMVGKINGFKTTLYEDKKGKSYLPYNDAIKIISNLQEGKENLIKHCKDKIKENTYITQRGDRQSAKHLIMDVQKPIYEEFLKQLNKE